MTATHKPIVGPARPWRPPPAPLAPAVRTVDRWGLLAGVTSVLANVLLVVLFTTPADGPYAWTGSANDVVGIVSTLAMIPVAAGLLAVCGNRPGLGAITSLAIVAMVMMAAVSLLFVLGLAPFTPQTDSSYAGLVIISGWVFAASHAGRASGRLPRQVANCGGSAGRRRAGRGGPARGVGADATPLTDKGHHLWRRIAGGRAGGAGLPGLADRLVQPAARPTWLTTPAR